MSYTEAVIILILVFLCTCRCTGKENMTLRYDSVPVSLRDNGLPYIRTKEGVVIVPNPKHNIHGYYSDHTNRCSSTSTDHADLEMAKKKTEQYVSLHGTGAIGGVKEVPSSATEIAKLIERSDE